MSVFLFANILPSGNVFNIVIIYNKIFVFLKAALMWSPLKMLKVALKSSIYVCWGKARQIKLTLIGLYLLTSIIRSASNIKTKPQAADEICFITATYLSRICHMYNLFIHIKHGWLWWRLNDTVFALSWRVSGFLSTKDWGYS